MLPGIPRTLGQQIQPALNEKRPLRDAPPVPESDRALYHDILTRLVNDARMTPAFQDMLRPGSPERSSTLAGRILGYLHFAAQRTCLISHIEVIPVSEYRQELKDIAEKIRSLVRFQEKVLGRLRKKDILLARDFLEVGNSVAHYYQSLDSERGVAFESLEVLASQEECLIPGYLRFLADSYEKAAKGDPLYEWREQLPMRVPRKMRATQTTGFTGKKYHEFLLRRELMLRYLGLFGRANYTAVARTVEVALAYGEIQPEGSAEKDTEEVSEDVLRIERNELRSKDGKVPHLKRFRYNRKTHRKIPP